MFEEEEAGKESRKHLSLSLDSTFHHCCLEKERDVELLHRDLSTALLVQRLSQKGLLGMSQKDNVIEEENTGKINPEEAKTDNKRELEMRLGRVVWHLQASLKCNTHGVGERVVQELEDGHWTGKLTLISTVWSDTFSSSSTFDFFDCYKLYHSSRLDVTRLFSSDHIFHRGSLL